MTVSVLSRRAFLGVSFAGLVSGTRISAQNAPRIHVFKDPNCGCCGAWIDILARSGFVVDTTEEDNSALIQRKIARGIPAEFASCHTANIEGYVIEGHVPVADILRLLDERPDAIGLSVPGMPFGSPGMGPESQREAYDVVLFRADGTSSVFSRYDAA